MKKLLLPLLMLTFSNVNAVSWGEIDATELTLFYPGQSSWEWLLTKHKGSKSVRKGATCMECHEGEEKEMGNTLVSGKKLESMPIKNKPGSIDIQLKSYYDKDQLYIWLQWQENDFVSGLKMDKEHKTKITIMLGDEHVREFPIGGCWGVCHDDATNMRSHKGDKQRNLYTSKSRVKILRTGGGDNVVNDDVLNAMFENGDYLEYWQTAIKSTTESSIGHGYILDKRNKQKETSINSVVKYDQGMWTVEMRRDLNPNQLGKINIDQSQTYTIGIALHDDYGKGRFHYISFPRSFSLTNPDSDIIAVRN